MPRKHHQHKWSHIKLPSRFSPSEELPQPSSVNSLLTHLRASQSHHHHDVDSPSAAPIAAIAPSVPPVLQQILGTVPTPPPRPRARINGRTARRGIPGPPPPASWLADDLAAANTATATETATAAASFASTNTHLPDLTLPPQDSLTHHTLLHISTNWPFHASYDQHHLRFLSPRLKSTLLEYIVAYSPVPLSALAFSALFPADEEDEVTHLNLARVPLSELVPLFGGAQTYAPVEESWDAVTETTRRFPALTHLGVGFPGRRDVRALLQLLKRAPGITHLSLAGWNPTVLREVARRTMCLQWLDVRGCGDLSEMMELEGVWAGNWRGVVVLVADKTQACSKEGLEGCVRGLRRAGGGGGWFEVRVEGVDSCE